MPHSGASLDLGWALAKVLALTSLASASLASAQYPNRDQIIRPQSATPTTSSQQLIANFSTSSLIGSNDNGVVAVNKFSGKSWKFDLWYPPYGSEHLVSVPKIVNPVLGRNNMLDVCRGGFAFINGTYTYFGYDRVRAINDRMQAVGDLAFGFGAFLFDIPSYTYSVISVSLQNAVFTGINNHRVAPWSFLVIFLSFGVGGTGSSLPQNPPSPPPLPRPGPSPGRPSPPFSSIPKGKPPPAAPSRGQAKAPVIVFANLRLNNHYTYNLVNCAGAYLTANTHGSYDPNPGGYLTTLSWELLFPNGSQALTHTSLNTSWFDFWTWTVFWNPSLFVNQNFNPYQSLVFTLNVTGTNNFGVSASISTPVYLYPSSTSSPDEYYVPQAYAGGPYHLTCTSTLTLNGSLSHGFALPSYEAQPVQLAVLYSWSIVSSTGQLILGRRTLSSPTLNISMAALRIAPGSGPYEILLKFVEFTAGQSYTSAPYQTTLYIPPSCP